MIQQRATHLQTVCHGSDIRLDHQIVRQVEVLVVTHHPIDGVHSALIGIGGKRVSPAVLGFDQPAELAGVGNSFLLWFEPGRHLQQVSLPQTILDHRHPAACSRHRVVVRERVYRFLGRPGKQFSQVGGDSIESVPFQELAVPVVSCEGLVPAIATEGNRDVVSRQSRYVVRRQGRRIGKRFPVVLHQQGQHLRCVRLDDELVMVRSVTLCKHARVGQLVVCVLLETD